MSLEPCGSGASVGLTKTGAAAGESLLIRGAQVLGWGAAGRSRSRSKGRCGGLGWFPHVPGQLLRLVLPSRASVLKSGMFVWCAFDLRGSWFRDQGLISASSRCWMIYVSKSGWTEVMVLNLRGHSSREHRRFEDCVYSINKKRL